ncbi:MAG: AbrB/MazE/SpoVT family DNA-binding domain-containing protein [Candidatus Methanoperedens sp.]|nr:AbrB/MazE/SpoVT family DNA-binding domain-containing protein [Candidatus Methanoperedens sp.]
MTTVTVSSKGQIVIPKNIRESFGLTEGNKLKIFRENRKIILIAEPEIKPSELFVGSSPEVGDEALKASRMIDEAKIQKLLNDIGIK